MTLRLSAFLIAIVLTTSCNREEVKPQSAVENTKPANPKISVLATGANLAGANGIHFSPENELYVASVIGSNITVINPDSGQVIRQLGAADGVIGPDDIAFSKDGSFYWTSILTGEVAGFTATGERIVAAQLTPGVNPITFADDGRLFVSQCFFGVNLYEVDPEGQQPARLISDELGPGCGLNGMDWGPDGRLYGPRWFTGEVVSFNVDDNTMRTEAAGFGTPAAVKFNSRGELHVLDTGTGEVIKIDGDERSAIAQLTPGLDNFAFDKDDRLFVSSFTDGFVKRVEPDGSLTTLLPSGMAHPGGLTVMGQEIVVADLHGIRFFDKTTGKETLVQRSVLGVSEMGGAINITSDGNNLILVSWLDNDVRVWDPKNEKVLERYSDLGAPVAAVRYAGKLIVTEHANHRVISVGAEGVEEHFTFDSPSGLAIFDQSLYLTDRTGGSIYLIGMNNTLLDQPKLVIEGLDSPEGIVAIEEAFIVVEAATGNIIRINADNEKQLLATISPDSPAAAEAQPPSMIFNGIAVDSEGIVYTAGETSRELYRITP